MKKVLITLVFVLFFTGLINAQINYTMQEAAQMYIDGIVYNNNDVLKKLNEYVKPIFSKDEITAGNLVPRPSLEDFAKDETKLFAEGYNKKDDASLKDAMYKYFIEEGKAVQTSKCIIKKVSITDDGKRNKIALVEFTCEIRDVDLNVQPEVTIDSPSEDLIRVFSEQTKRFQNSKNTRTANLSFDMYGKVIKGGNGLIIWYLPMPNFINQVINMEITKSEVKE